MRTMPTIETSENRPRYGHSPIRATTAARRSRMVTNTCVPRKTIRPRISSARPILQHSTLSSRRLSLSQALTSRAADHGRGLTIVNDSAGRSRRVFFAAREIARGVDDGLPRGEGNHITAHRGSAAVACDCCEHTLHGLDRGTLRIAWDDHKLVAEFLQARHRQQRRLAALEHVDELPSGKALGNFGDLGFGGRRLDKAH